jgi:uracil-DNA glycosylase family 4
MECWVAGYHCDRLAECTACPRLVALRHEIREAHPDYHAAPVPAWGSRSARLLIVGLAPGRHGANRTGQPFTGDASGVFLFAALARAGFASTADAATARLKGARITNAVKCLPPGNRPLAAEVRNCSLYLSAELATLRGRVPRRPRCVLCLGRLAHDATLLAARSLGIGEDGERKLRKAGLAPDFRHGAVVEIARNLFLVDTYHPSRQNTNTGRLTATMLDDVLRTVRKILDDGRPGSA